MTVKITDKMLSIPPYISTSWSHIASLHMKGTILVVTMVDGDTLQIPNLSNETVHSIFQHHASYLEKGQVGPPESTGLIGNGVDGSPIRFAFGPSPDAIGGMIQHNPAQANGPDIPHEVLEKISAITKILGGPGEDLGISAAVPNCNCFYCQVARVVKPEASPTPQVQEEDNVSDAELEFQQWLIQKTGEQLYLVVNRLDEHERYNVYLGEPVGCTCGKQGCEHILAVLKS